MVAKMTSYTTVAGLNAALRKIPRLASIELRDASEEIAGEVAADARGRAVSVGGVAKHVAPTIKASRDRVPVVRMGGVNRLPPSEGHPRRSSRGQTTGDVMWGAEFGGKGRPRTQQFRPHRGTVGYFLWPAVRAHSDDTQATYSLALLGALRKI